MFDDYDDDLQFIANKYDQGFVDDLGFAHLSGSLVNDYPAVVQVTFMELPNNGSFEGKSELDEARLFDELPAAIHSNANRLKAAFWVLHDLDVKVSVHLADGHKLRDYRRSSKCTTRCNRGNSSRTGSIWRQTY